ncbi:RND transporter, Hydrophobe/Amphiphile Efflux-1 (HAE1)/Heavy Metal Efflux (HME) family, permease protein [Leptospira fainei serovar Hurstbridge str. BUT 6]|uniref:RND transporter, Hydrophobe/Amphiphile Efflux-1 (HAE1)/Heavy Metal Efflux (HME) family, permease protein n=1 Tax=Leptospira fainei serovar Hurstbridge str. BUT 6 TaxID=1193011 RepID=S3V8C4_9LEPT|nr:efflux RND transporter permease subunit [Leptospira fainei]EPG72660.1 RND transporter, Hydrophobe/Amphiphile Efflux-1 (HAE1)/Heavy Metal Efflux (HME) family, permease protein [Leptospira fainei serovar Hurstbridge str. BUT 6]
MNNTRESALGFAGKLADLFINSRLTPVISIASILLGVLAVTLTPKEEEPQISVPMVDIHIASPGFVAKETERKVVEPIERAVWGLEGVEYVYSASSDHGALITVRFKVGEPLEPSLVKIHHSLMEIKSSLPPNVLEPNVRSYTIDDVPFLALTFSSETRDDFSLRSTVAPLARELSSTPDIARMELLGGRKEAVRVIADPKKMQVFGLSISDIANGIRANNGFMPSGKNWGKDFLYDIEIGTPISNSKQIALTPLVRRGGNVVRVSDVAEVRDGAEEKVRQSSILDKSFGPAHRNAVTILFSKRKGTDIAKLSQEILQRSKFLAKDLPDDIAMTVLRDYGATAGDKSTELIEHLLIATFSVSVLIAIWMGIRASFVVSISIPVTLSLTLALYYFLGYTLNRVTLFALIFSIGILVDDAIVVVENIERHLKLKPGQGIVRTTLKAVSEVGNPTILATFTVIAAILPMAFVRGLMGPYMKPIPVGASLAMILSLLVAFIVTPWASVRFLKLHSKTEKKPVKDSMLNLLYESFTAWLLYSRKNAILFGLSIIILLLTSFSLVAFKFVKVKMLPFDDKEEFQVLIDYDPKTPLEKTTKYTRILADSIINNSNIQKIQIFVGDPAPFSFSGMVKHSFLRNKEWQADLHIVLKNKNERNKKSHDIIESLRPSITEFGEQNNAITKVLEIPPGPPVLATFVAEVYAPTEKEREEVAFEIRKSLSMQKGVVDIDSSLRVQRPTIVFPFDYVAAGNLGVQAVTIAQAANYVFQETSLSTLSETNHSEDVVISLSLKDSARTSKTPFAKLNVSTLENGSIQADKVLDRPAMHENRIRNRKNLRSLEYVFAEFSGAEESPVYGILNLSDKVKHPTFTSEIPSVSNEAIVKWDGEWFITYEVFRDLGISFAIVMLIIYVLVLGWFQDYVVPLIIMAPIPISLIGILPGHWLLGAYFTATSMIGFIAGAGIIVRNSIILVDFINSELDSGTPLRQAVINAGLVRFRPMLLTASAVVVGSSVMLFDPIFQGLAISLIFGEIAATLLSRFAIPAIYYWFLMNRGSIPNKN